MRRCRRPRRGRVVRRRGRRARGAGGPGSVFASSARGPRRSPRLSLRRARGEGACVAMSFRMSVGSSASRARSQVLVSSGSERIWPLSPPQARRNRRNSPGRARSYVIAATMSGAACAAEDCVVVRAPGGVRRRSNGFWSSRRGSIAPEQNEKLRRSRGHCWDQIARQRSALSGPPFVQARPAREYRALTIRAASSASRTGAGSDVSRTWSGIGTE